MPKGKPLTPITIMCNIPHTISPGVCALCERDKAIREIQAYEQAIMETTNLWTSVSKRAGEILRHNKRTRKEPQP